MGKKMRYVKSVAVWGNSDIPKGYVSVAVLILDPDSDLFFTVAVPVAFLEKASELDKARVVGQTVLRELVGAVKNASR